MAAVLAAGLLGGALTAAGAAWAHAALVASDPADGGELSGPPTRVSATFNEPMQPQFAAMTVIGPDGEQWNTGEPIVDGPVLSVGVRARGPAGSYTVNYRATSADGHVVSGSWTYRVMAAPAAPATPAAPPTTTAAAPAAPAAPATPADPPADGMPVWPFVAAATAVVAAGAVWAVRRNT